MTPIQQLLGSPLPIIQAPMAGVQLSALAAAVSNAGGLGSLPCAQLTAAALQTELRQLSAAARGAFNVNFFCHTPPAPDAAREAKWRELLAPYYAEFDIDPSSIGAGSSRLPFDDTAASLLESFKPRVISFHFGLPSDALMQRVKAMGAAVLASATTVEEARWLEARGVDAVIAQGVEAGGHRGCFLTEDVTMQVGTFALVPQIVKAVRVPVIAAGGIADAAGVRAALALGASAVQVGTSYLLCAEAATSAVHRAALQSPDAAHTAITNLFTGRPARGIVNRIMRELGPLRSDLPPFPLATAAIAPLRAKVEVLSRGDFSPLWSGQNASGCKAIGAGELTRALASL